MSDALPLDIVIVNDFAHINGGAGQVALTSAIGLAERGHRVTLLSAVEPVMGELVRSGVRTVVTGQYEIASDPNRLRAATQGLWNGKAQRSMRQVLDTLDRKNTIVHAHSWTKSLSASVIAEAMRREFKVVCTLHDYFVACPNGGFYDHQRNTICDEIPLSAGCVFRNCDVRSYPQKLWRVARQILQKSSALIPSGIKHFITVSDFSEAVLKDFLPIGAGVYRIDNPIDVQPRNCIDAGSNEAFIYVGRLSREKGVTMFACAANQLGIAPVFVGDGKCSDEIRRCCPNAEITGWLSRDRVIERLGCARALVLPSLWYETQGLVVAEAAALGVPVIVADTCAGRDMVLDGQSGLWFRGGDNADLLEKMRALLVSDDLTRMLGRSAYQRYWTDPYTMTRHIAQLENCYGKILL